VLILWQNELLCKTTINGRMGGNLLKFELCAQYMVGGKCSDFAGNINI
jgi:hypothetical protein